MGGKCIVTLTGWTHPLHTNTKRKCVSILCIAEQSVTNFIGMGVNTHILKNVVYKTRVVKTPKKLVSCHNNASVADGC